MTMALILHVHLPSPQFTLPFIYRSVMEVLENGTNTTDGVYERQGAAETGSV